MTQLTVFVPFPPPPGPTDSTSGDADYSGASRCDADGQEIKEDSVVVDDVFGEGITHAIVPLEHGDFVTTCAPTGSQRRIHSRRQVAADNLR